MLQQAKTLKRGTLSKRDRTWYICWFQNVGLTPDSLPNTLPVLLGHCSFTSVINYRCYRIPSRITCPCPCRRKCHTPKRNLAYVFCKPDSRKSKTMYSENNDISPCFFGVMCEGWASSIIKGQLTWRIILKEINHCYWLGNFIVKRSIGDAPSYPWH